jgi:hypothetical protein
MMTGLILAVLRCVQLVLVHTSNFSCAESNANELKQRTWLINIRLRPRPNEIIRCILAIRQSINVSKFKNNCQAERYKNFNLFFFLTKMQ